jgi:hypothetical protein
VKIPLRGGHYTSDPRLDRVVQYDPKSLNYLIRDLPAVREGVKWTKRTWNSGAVVLDQGREGACVGFAWTHWTMTTPKPYTGLDATAALDLYRRAQQLDEWAGEAYSGSSTLGGVKALVEEGRLGSYFWAKSLEDIVLAVLTYGPVVVGSDWYADMFTPQSGLVSATGGKVGGHEYVIKGVDRITQRARIRNSWGADWGVKGEADISFTDLEKLLLDGGDCCLPRLKKKQVAA